MGDDDINTHSDDIFGDVAKKLDEESVSDDDMNCSEESDHGSIQDEVFEGYDDDKKDEQQKNMAKISECISVLRDAEKLKLASFETMDALLQSDDSRKYFDLLSKHFETRQEKLIQLKKTSTNV